MNPSAACGRLFRAASQLLLTFYGLSSKQCFRHYVGGRCAKSAKCFSRAHGRRRGGREDGVQRATSLLSCRSDFKNGLLRVRFSREYSDENPAAKDTAIPRTPIETGSSSVHFLFPSFLQGMFLYVGGAYLVTTAPSDEHELMSNHQQNPSSQF